MKQEIRTEYKGQNLDPLTWAQVFNSPAVVYTRKKNRVNIDGEGIDFWFNVRINGRQYMVHPTGEVIEVRDSIEYSPFLVANPGDSVTIRIKEAL